MALKALTVVRTRLKEAVEKPLDGAVRELASTLQWLWDLESRHELPAEDTRAIVSAFQQTVKRLAPPPPKKRTLSTPLPKIPPLAEENVLLAVDVVTLLVALAQIGDFTEQSDKDRERFFSSLNDWRRRVFESAKVKSFGRFRELIGAEDLTMHRRFSRGAACDLLEAIEKRAADKFTILPDASMIGCDRCGGFGGRDRLRCHTCRGLFCTKCFSRASDVCLRDYAARFAGLDAGVRGRVAAGAAELVRQCRLSEFVRNEDFVRVLAEEGVDVVFQEGAPHEGIESEAGQGRHKLVLRPGETVGNKRLLFAALGRAFFRSATAPVPPPEDDPEAPPGPPPFEPSSLSDPLFLEFFVDVCLGVPLEEALSVGHRPRTSGPS